MNEIFTENHDHIIQTNVVNAENVENVVNAEIVENAENTNNSLKSDFNNFHSNQNELNKLEWNGNNDNNSEMKDGDELMPEPPPKTLHTFNYVVKQLISSRNVFDVLHIDPDQESSLILPYQNSNLVPNNTIYINHLNEKITVNNLKILLRSLCERYGKILNIHVHDAKKRKGQAWIVYDSIESAKRAVEELHGIELDGKRIGVQFSCSTSDPIAKRIGTFELQKRKREIERRMNAGVDQFYKEMKKRRTTFSTFKKSLPSTVTTSTTVSHGDGPQPHNILLVQGLTNLVSKEDLENMFSNFPGFQLVRYIEAKKVALIDFDSEQNATLALDAHEMKINGVSIQVNYAKK